MRTYAPHGDCEKDRKIGHKIRKYYIDGASKYHGMFFVHWSSQP